VLQVDRIVTLFSIRSFLETDWFFHVAYFPRGVNARIQEKARVFSDRMMEIKGSYMPEIGLEKADFLFS